MHLKILEGDRLIGEAEIYALDPPMCVAMAKFEPTGDYDPRRHANALDGEYIGDRSDILRLELSDGSALRSEAISIQDFPTIAEREVQLLGIFEPSFDDLFAEHPHFKEYWGAK
ncbi:MAG: hypothetical protein AAFP79_14740 [Pseudomonadota bacterium]